MGGYGSGRPGWRAVLEGQTRIDIRHLRRNGWLRPGPHSIAWSRDSDTTASVSYTIHDDTLELLYRTRGDAADEWINHRVSVPIVHSHCRYGGRRAYWECPRCFRRCEVLAFAGRALWACRKCLRLAYQSQRLAPADRLQLRADRLYARAGTDYGDGFVVKRKWMRWRTFNRLMDRANATSNCADALFLCRLRRFSFAGDTIEDAIAGILREAR